MSDAPAAPVPENGVPPVTQDSKAPAATTGFKVFAGNLAYSTTDEGLKAFFEPVQSDIISAQVIQRRSRHGSRSAGYGFVALATAEASQQAVEALNKTELDGRLIIVEIAKPAEEKDREHRPRRSKKRSTGRRGPKSVPGEVTEAEANGQTTDKAEAAPAAGGAEKPKKKKKKNNRRNKGRSARRETAPLDADAPATDEPTEGVPKPRQRKLRAPRPPRPAGEDPVGEPSKSVLFVANLGFNIDDAGLAALFTDAGIKVTSARIVRRRWGKPRKSKGYGFVDVGDEAEQKKAIDALQGKEIGGRAIAVKIAVNTPHDDEKADREPTPEATVVAS
jgi:RNA recognition motif-containing protein